MLLQWALQLIRSFSDRRRGKQSIEPSDLLQKEKEHEQGKDIRALLLLLKNVTDRELASNSSEIDIANVNPLSLFENDLFLREGRFGRNGTHDSFNDNRNAQIPKTLFSILRFVISYLRNVSRKDRWIASLQFGDFAFHDHFRFKPSRNKSVENCTRIS